MFDEHGPKILLYADDTVLYYSHHDIKYLYQQLNFGLEKITDWCNKNKLTINGTKTKYINK